MPNKTDSPAIFISYAWSSVDKDNWVIELAERLFSSGVIVKLDKWDLEAGQDKYVFMEQMVQNSEIKYVLVVCDKNYKEKSDARQGGVGTESQIISSEVYSKTDQKKFIPIIREFDDDRNPLTPIFFKTRIYLDFSSDDVYEESYEKLLRIIFGKPEIKRPELGSPPAYLFENEPTRNKFAAIVKQAVHAAKLEKPHSISLVKQFLGNLIEGLDEFSLLIEYETPDKPFDDLVVNSIDSLQPIKEQFLELFESVVIYLPNFDYDAYINFFENLSEYFHARKEGRSYRNNTFDNFRFFGQDLFVSSIAILLRHEKYVTVADLIYGPYFPKNKFGGGTTEAENCEFLNHYIVVLDQDRNSRLKLNRISLTADILKEKVSQFLKFEEFVLAEAIIFNATLLNTASKGFGRDWWYPRTSVYFSYEINSGFFKKMKSKKHFDKVKILFRATSKSDIISKNANAMAYLSQRNVNFGFHDRPPFLSQFIKLEDIDSV